MGTQRSQTINLDVGLSRYDDQFFLSTQMHFFFTSI